MKLEIDCVRDILLEFEDLPVGCYSPFIFERSVAKYGIDNVEYTLKKLSEAGYINADIYAFPNGQTEFNGIFDITFSGHQFLEKIRDNKVWAKTKSVAGSVGSRAFDVITQIATSVITGLISSHLNV